jgi:2-amino-4-hydroxy-6-hydroxymethyldihydropteridine diphosphokinase
MHTVFLLLGSNLGNRPAMLQQARTLLTAQVGYITAQSACYESEPWGFEADTQFMNQVIQVNTLLAPEPLLHTILQIEQQLGRVRTTSPHPYTSRVIDIDILFYDDEIIHTLELTIPHPLLHRRRFTLLPLHEIAPQYIHPVLRQTIAVLLQQCDDPAKVRVKCIPKVGEKQKEFIL